MGIRSFPRRRRTAPLVALAALSAAGLGRAAPVAAKEHGAGCENLPVVIERLRNALAVAAVHRARGSDLATYAVLRTTARGVAGPTPDARPEACGALVRPLAWALARAERAHSSAEAVSELEVGYAGVLSLALTGRLPRRQTPPHPPAVPVSAQLGIDCPDLFALARRLDGDQAGAPARVHAVVADLARRPRCALVRRVLENATTENVSYAIDSIVLDERDDETPNTDETPPPTAALVRCPELPAIVQLIGAAVTAGAPLYNRGDHGACRDIYERAAKSIATTTIPPARCPFVRVALAGALREARAAADASAAAWALRRAFDRITGVAER